jgi:WD40 repeat protein
VAFSPGGTRLAVWDHWGHLSLWDLELGRTAGCPPGTIRPPGKLAFSPEGRYLAWGSPARPCLRLFDLETGGEAFRDATTFAFTPSGQLVLAEPPANLSRVDTGGPALLGQAALSFRMPFPIRCHDLAVSPDGRILAAAAGEHGLCLWDAHTGEPVHRFEDAACTGPLAWSPDGTVLACGVTSRFWKAILWDEPTRQRRAVLGGTAALAALAFSPDGQWLVTCEEDAVRTWDVQTGQERLSLTMPGERALSLAFSRDGRTVALGMSGPRVRLWPAEMLRPEG